MLPYRCVNAFPLRTGDGTHQRLVTFPPWLTEDIWVTGINVIIYPYDTVTPINVSYLMCGVNTGLVADTPVFNFCLCGDSETDFDFPPGLGIFFPGIGHLTPQRNICVFAKVPTGQASFIAFTTLRYQLASEVTGYQEPKVKTLNAGADHQVPFVLLQEPWETFAIDIIGVETALDQGYAVSQHVCNSASPDILVNAGPGKKSMRKWLQPGVSARLPAIGETYPKHIDMHVNLGPGTEPRPHHVWMLVYYLPAVT